MTEKIYSLDEIKNIVMPIAKRYEINKVYLFGSYARGEAQKHSDLDFCIDAPSIRGFFELGGLYEDLKDAFQKDLDLLTEKSLKYNNDIAFKSNLQKDRVLIYEQ